MCRARRIRAVPQWRRRGDSPAARPPRRERAWSRAARRPHARHGGPAGRHKAGGRASWSLPAQWGRNAQASVLPPPPNFRHNPVMRSALRIAVRALLPFLAIPSLYILAALLLGMIPANADWHEARDGVRIFVRTNGVHTWVMVPTVSPDMDWRPLVPGSDLKDPRWGRGNYVAF